LIWEFEGKLPLLSSISIKTGTDLGPQRSCHKKIGMNLALCKVGTFLKCANTAQQGSCQEIGKLGSLNVRRRRLIPCQVDRLGSKIGAWCDG